MGCNQSKPAEEPFGIRYQKANLPQPFSSDYQNNFEKEIFMAINMLRNNPKSFIPHI